MAKNKNKITLVIPVHMVNDEFKDYFTKALDSIKNQKTKIEKVLVVACECPDVKDFFENFKHDVEFDIYHHNKGKDFISQMNYITSKIKTEYFSFLEFDDELSAIWHKVALEYINEYPNVSVFLPIIVEATNDTEPKFIDFSNQTLWAMNFSERLGYLDNATLERYPNFNTSGAIFKLSDWESIGGLKQMKLSFWLEFLYRATHNSMEIMTIPKIMYKHTNGRTDSLFIKYRNELSKEEAKFWLDSAKTEQYYNFDRNLKYEAN